MNNLYTKSRLNLTQLWPFVLTLLLSCYVVSDVKAQASKPSDLAAPPSEEKFLPASDVISPWNTSGCFIYNLKMNEPGCYQVSSAKRQETSDFRLYEANGKLWHRFSLIPYTPSYVFRDGQKDGFAPLTLFNYADPQNVLLRLVAESQHWYEVEVDEKSRKTKYVLKSDPHWVKTTWEHWLKNGMVIHHGPEPAALLDKPNGKVIEESESIRFWYFELEEVEGDWIRVRAIERPPDQSRRFTGWLRWRNGRDMLLGCYFNNFYKDLDGPRPDPGRGTKYGQ